MVSRTPPEPIRRCLRKEVNFGCPVQGCGIPYLTWHHFEPTWEVKEHHDPDGMIALCHTHADWADGKKWTKDQLRQMKQNPFVSHKMEGPYGYLRKDTVCIVGNIAVHVKNVLEIDGERVIGFERDSDGYDRLNILIRDSEGSTILQMENDDWTYTHEVFDLICPPQGKQLQIISKDKKTDFTIRFDEYPLIEFGNLLYVNRFTSNNIVDLIYTIGTLSEIPVWTMTGKFAWGKNHLKIDNFAITIHTPIIENGHINGNVVIGRTSAIRIESEKLSIG
jgi:hypothetical protein